MTKPSSLGDARQIAEHHKWVMEGVALRVRPGERRRPIGVHGTEHVVIGEEVTEAHLLDSGPDTPDRDRVSSKLDLRVYSTDLHDIEFAM